MEAYDTQRVGRHPATGSPPILIPRFGQRDRSVFEAFAPYGLQTIAQSIAQNAASRSIAARARLMNLGLIVDPETHRNQLRRAQRTESFNRLEISFPRSWAPEQEHLSPGSRRRYLEATLNEQRGRGATVLIPPYHLVGGSGSSARALDLRFVRDAVDMFGAYAEPDLVPALALYAGVAVHVGLLLDPGECSWMIEAYSDLEVDGYWIKVDGLSPESSVPAIEAAGNFVFGLQRISGRPVILVGPGNLYLAFLASKLAATSIGVGQSERVRFTELPETFAPTHRVYHGTLLRNVVPTRTPRSAAMAEAAFDQFPCDCGHHPPNAIPRGAGVPSHTLSVRVHEALALGRLADRQESEAELLRVVMRANDARRAIGYDLLDIDRWRAVSQAAVAVDLSAARSHGMEQSS